MTGREIALRQMAWWPLQLARPVWRLAPHLLEMRYLWNTPHCLDGAVFDDLVQGFVKTELIPALRTVVSGITSARMDQRGNASLLFR